MRLLSKMLPVLSNPDGMLGDSLVNATINRYQSYQTILDRSQEAGRNPQSLRQDKSLAWRFFSDRGRSNCGRATGLGTPAASGWCFKQAKDILFRLFTVQRLFKVQKTLQIV